MSVPSAARPAAGSHHVRLKNTYFAIAALNGLATSYYFNYLFFYLKSHFGFGNEQNLLLTATHGALYTVFAWNAGRIAHKLGHVRLLTIGFTCMMATLAASALAPHVWEYSPTTLTLQCGAFVLWTINTCIMWPTIQGLLSRNEPASELPHLAGVYNIVWASGSAISYLTGGAMLDRFGGAILFWVPASLHLGELILLAWTQTRAFAGERAATAKTATPTPVEHPPVPEKARVFLLMAWMSNPFAYVSSYVLIPIIPRLADKLGLSDAAAGVVCSIWLWVRLGAFIWFWLWPGWHYRFNLLLTAFGMLAASFAAILLVSNLWIIIAAQVAFGLAMGLIYYSSLFYTMDTGAFRGKRGGTHESVIGMGMFSGPALGAVVSRIAPGNSNAAIWAITALLLLGFCALAGVRLKHRRLF
jgi:predicted MFS family arabinose efflux permease